MSTAFIHDLFTFDYLLWHRDHCAFHLHPIEFNKWYCRHLWSFPFDKGGTGRLMLA